MRTINKQTWPRRQHFELFSAYGYPHFGMSANVDLTTFYPAVKQRRYSFTITVVYLVTRTANAIPEFRYRIRGEDIIEHDVVSPGFTFLAEEDAFSFCFVDYCEDFPIFATEAARQIAFIKENPWVEQIPQDNVLYMTAIPWVSFTSFLHPMRLQPEDSIPRFVWGKYFWEGERLLMPLGVQGHHALVDGLHVGRFYTLMQEYLEQPEVIFGEV